LLGNGPFLISFNQTKQKENIHIEIDGEFYNLEHPCSIYIQQTEGFNNGTIKVLALNSKEARCKFGKFEGQTIDVEKNNKKL
jgi:hypothetical protein